MAAEVGSGAALRVMGSRRGCSDIHVSLKAILMTWLFYIFSCTYVMNLIMDMLSIVLFSAREESNSIVSSTNSFYRVVLTFSCGFTNESDDISY